MTNLLLLSHLLAHQLRLRDRYMREAWQHRSSNNPRATWLTRYAIANARVANHKAVSIFCAIREAQRDADITRREALRARVEVLGELAAVPSLLRRQAG